MKQFSFIIVLLILTGCQQSLEVNYASRLGNCMDAQDRYLINNAMAAFEERLIGHYGDIPKNHYTLFLEDLSEDLMADTLFYNEEALVWLEQMGNTGTLGKIYRIQGGILSTEPRTPVTDSGGTFFNCLQRANENQNLRNLLRTSGDLPAGVREQARMYLEQLSDSDYRDDIVKMAIGFNFYYLILHRDM